MENQPVDDHKTSEFIMSVGNQLIKCLLLDDGQHIQANIVTSHDEGIGAWAIFDSTTDNVTIANALAPLVRHGSLAPNMDVTEQVRGALAAGTAQLPDEYEELVPQTTH